MSYFKSVRYVSHFDSITICLDLFTVAYICQVQMYQAASQNTGYIHLILQKLLSHVALGYIKTVYTHSF